MWQADDVIGGVHVSPRTRLVRTALSFATRTWVPEDGDGARIDPLRRLLDPEFTEKTWYYEFSKIGDMPGMLHPKQLEALNHDAAHRWLFWGNQSGKTTLGAVDLVLKALGRHPLQLAGKTRMPPRTAWASALGWELWERILLPELLSWIPQDRILDAPTPFKHSTKRDIVILADNGRESRITGKAAEQGADKYQSARVHDVWLDEEHPEEVWDEMQPRLLRFGGKTIATMTPLKGFTWVHGRVYEPIRTGRLPAERHWYSHAGIADNPGIEAAAIEELKEELKHNPSQLSSRLKGLFTRPEGAVLPWDPEKHLTKEPFAPDDPKMIIARGRVQGRALTNWYGGLDLGKWGFAFVFGYTDHEGVFTLVDEYFSQNEDVDTRAKGMDAKLKHWRIPDTISIPADCADPKGIEDLNAALERCSSKYSVFAIEGELKAKTAGISRVENMLNRGAFLVRRGMSADLTWMLGMKAGSKGQPIMGSRWMWEASNWQYPKAADGKVQKDEPDDATADGAHTMDATRYLIMKHFAADPLPKPKKHPTRLERIQKEMEALDKQEIEEDDRRHGGGGKYGTILRQG